MTMQQRWVVVAMLVVVAVAAHFSFIEWEEPLDEGFLAAAFRSRPRSSSERSERFAGPDLWRFRARVEDKRNADRVPIYLFCGLGIPAALIGVGVYLVAGAKKSHGK